MGVPVTVTYLGISTARRSTALGAPDRDRRAVDNRGKGERFSPPTSWGRPWGPASSR